MDSVWTSAYQWRVEDFITDVTNLGEKEQNWG